MRIHWTKRITLGALTLALGALMYAATATRAHAQPAEQPASTPAPTPMPTPERALLALSKADHTLAIVDPATLKVVARMPVGPDPHEVIASADGRTAYVSNMGGDRLHELDIIDLVAQKPSAPFDTGALTGLHGLAFAGGKVWFTAQGAKAVARFDPAASKVDWILGTGQDRTHMIFVSDDEKKIYATNVVSGTLSLIESVERPPMAPPPGAKPDGGPPPGGMPPETGPHTEWVQTLVPVAKGSEGFDVSPDGKELWKREC